MAHTDVLLTNDGGTVVPSLPSVAVMKGDSVSFASESGEAFLFFSPAAAAALSPEPKGPVPVSASTKVTFTFTASAAGAYSVFFGATATAKPASFPLRHSSELLLEIASDGEGFPGPQTGTKD